MRCPRCDYSNRPSARFCIGCGSKLNFRQTNEVHVHSSIPHPNQHNHGSPITDHVEVKRWKIFVSIIVIVILLGSSYGLWWSQFDDSLSDDESLWDPGFDVEALITAEDKAFYDKYPQAPMLYSLTKSTLTQTCDILFECRAISGDDLPIFTDQLGRTVALYSWVMESAQVTESIDNLAERIIQDVSNDRVSQAKAMFEFVSRYLEYSLDGAYEFPVTALLEREGQCSEFASLLTSLYSSLGFKTYYVLTLMDVLDYYQLGHIWVALYLPEYEPTDPGQDVITSRLGDGWLGLDTTGNQCNFGELYGILDYHSNIVSIVEPVTNVTIYDVAAAWDSKANGKNAVHLEVYLRTWEAGLENDDKINLTFKLYEHDKVVDRISFNLNKNEDMTIEVDLNYNMSSWKGSGEQYITISVD